MEGEFRELYFDEIFKDIIRKWWIIAIIVILSTSIGYFVTVKFMKPVYKAETILFIGKESGDIGDIGISLNDLDTNSQLFVDYRQLAGTRLVIEKVCKDLKIDMSIENFKKSMNVYNIENSRLFGVSFTSGDPQLAMNAANEIAKQITLAAAALVEVKNIRIVDMAILPTVPFRPSKMINTAVSGLLGLIFALYVIVIQSVLDNRIHSEEDFEKISTIPVIGIIPKFKGDNSR